MLDRIYSYYRKWWSGGFYLRDTTERLKRRDNGALQMIPRPTNCIWADPDTVIFKKKLL